MMDDVEQENCNLLKKIESDDGDKESVSLPSLRQQSQALVRTQSVHSTISDITKAYLTLRNVQYSHAPSSDICSLAVSTFEKMDLSTLRLLEKLSNSLKEDGQIGTDQLKVFTMKIMTEVWCCDEKLEALLKSDPVLTEMLGKELLVVFDNVMSDPVYQVTKTGKPQRYTRACLDNTIQPMYADNAPNDKWSTYETVISTYTSPTAFTPEMESLIKTATQLGISTNDLNLKKFVTERSLSAFLKTLIQAKLKKSAFIKKFNSKLMGILSHSPNIEDNGASNKFKYSFSKLYQFVEPDTDSKSSPDFHHASIRRLSARGSRSRFSIHKGGLFANERMGDFTVQRHYNDKRNERPDTICNRCHETNKEDCSRGRGLVKSLSDSCLSLPTCESITCCQCFDTARRVWDKRPMSASRQTLLSNSTKFSEKKKRSSLKHSLQPIKELPIKTFTNEKGGFGLLTEQRSFFRLGQGALRDALTEYVEAKNANCIGETNRKAVTTKKRVRWVDETSFSSVYGSLMDSESEFVMLGSRSSSRHPIIKMSPLEKLLCFLLQEPLSDDSRIVAVCEKPMKRVFLQALMQATLIAMFLWICLLLYLQTPEVAKKLKRLSLGPWLQILMKNPIV